MAPQPLQISFQGRTNTREPLDLLMIEQEEWKPYTGYVTKANIVKWLANALYGAEDEVYVDCGMIGDHFVCGIFAYPFERGLAYRLETSWGELSERAEEEIEVKEIVNVGLKKDNGRVYSEEQLHFPAHAILETKWLSRPFDAEGNQTISPAITADDRNLRFSSPVYGAVEVTYMTIRHAYILNVPKRVGSIENHFSAAVYGIYSGGIKWIEVEPPPGAEEMNLDADCGYNRPGSNVSFTDDEEGPIDQPERHANRRIVQDYCSKEIISDETYAF